VCVDIESGGFTARVDILAHISVKFLDFVPLGRNKLITLTEGSLIGLYEFNHLTYRQTSEFDLRTLEASSDDLEVATICICQRN
jgi:hypothetical protein